MLIPLLFIDVSYIFLCLSLCLIQLGWKQNQGEREDTKKEAFAINMTTMSLTYGFNQDIYFQEKTMISYRCACGHNNVE